MSDFDREAEREKLREKYEEDTEDREATERMSDLLLKGATMTNAHCGTCGDPIFRYEGQEFCPSCQEVVAEDGEPDEAAANAEATPDPGSASAAETAASNAPVDTSTDASADTDPNDAVDAAEETPTPTPSRSASETGAVTEPRRDDRGDAGRPHAGRSARSEPSDAAATGSPRDVSTPVETTVTGGGDGLAEARASLTRTVTELAQRAERSDDVERIRAYLAATEEAAEALSAVRRADR